MKKIPFCLGFAMVGAAILAPARGATIVIDNFNDAFAAETFYNPDGSFSVVEGLEVGAMRLAPGVLTVRESETQTQTGLSGVLGGQRTGTLTRTAPIGSTALSRVARAGSGSFEWAHTNGSPTKSIATLEYGNAAALNADFSTLGAGGYFHLAGWQLAEGTVDATVTITSGVITQSQTISLAPASFENPGEYSIFFSAFDLINFSDVDVIQLRFANNDFSQDSALTSFSVRSTEVPDGGLTVALLAGSLAGLVGLRRRWA